MLHVRLSLFPAVVLALAAALSLTGAASAAITGPVYPAPGGNTFAAGSGNTGINPGKTNTYSGFNPAAYTDLYWGSDATNIVLSYTGGTEALTFSSSQSNLPAGKLVWVGSTVLNTQFSGSPPVTTRLTLTATDTANNPLALTSAASLGLPANIGGLVHVAGDFKDTLLFEGTDPFNANAYNGALTVYNNVANHGTPSAYASSFSGGFFSTPAPEASPALVLTIGLLGIGMLRLKARRA